MTEKNEVIVIMGMGRSGTSLVCQILSALGVYLGEPHELIGKTPINLKGQYEHVKISQVLETCLKASGIDHWLTKDPVEWRSVEAYERARERLGDEIASLHARAANRNAPAVAFKDARATLLGDLVRETLAERGLTPRWVRCLRHPDAFVKSVLNTGAPYADGYLEEVWEHFWSLTEYIKLYGDPFTTVDYERWFEDPELQLTRVCRDLELEADYEALSAIDASLRHAG